MSDAADGQRFAVEWRRLHAEQLELRRALAAASDAAERAPLVARIRAGKAAIADLEEQRTAAVADGSDHGRRLTLVQTAHSNGHRATAEADEDAEQQIDEDGAAEEVDELLEQLVFRHEEEEAEVDELLEQLVFRHERSEPEDAAAEELFDPPPLPRRVLAGFAAAVAVALLALVALVWSRSSAGDPGDAPLGNEVAESPATDGAGSDPLAASARLGSTTAGLDEGIPSSTGESAAPLAPGGAQLRRVGLVAPSSRTDRSFTESMVDSLEVIAAEHGNLEISIVDGVTSPRAAAEAIETFADEGYDLVVVHSSVYWDEMLEVAADYPDTIFAGGTVSVAPEQSNVYSYTVAAEQGGYVLGALAAQLSSTGVVGAVGPVDVGVSARVLDAYQAGAEAERPGTTVWVRYAGSFSDAAAFDDTTETLIGAGADVVLGQGQALDDAIDTAADRNIMWMGNQADQAPFAPSAVAASQIYRWEVALRVIIDDLERGAPGGRHLTAELANGGLVIEFNPTASVTDTVQRRADVLVRAIIDGTLDPLVG